MAWFLLAVTILLEVAGTISMKLSNGLTKLVPSIGIFVFYGFCFAIFALVVKKIELSIAYAIWSGVGTMLVFVVSVLIFKESFSWIKFFSILLIIAGVIGLKVSDTEDEPHSVVQPVQQIDVE